MICDSRPGVITYRYKKLIVKRKFGAYLSPLRSGNNIFEFGLAP